MELPLYELKIDGDESLVEAIALVESPAIESDFLAFSKQQENLTFSVDDEKMELLGAAMIPDMRIYRRNPDGKEYNVFFSKETIRKISQIFFKKGFQGNLNIEHSLEHADSYVFQSLIVDKAKGIAPMDLPDGTWVIGVKVNNPEVWKDIKEGKRKGFSVEGVFQLVQAEFKTDDNINNNKDEAEVLALLQQLNQLLAKRQYLK